MNKVFKVGLIGCGHIAETYFRAHKYFNNFKIIKCADIKLEAAKKCAKKYGIKYLSVNELLNNKEIEVILNLTVPSAHYEISSKSLKANKHCYCEKPMAVTFADGLKLHKLARKNKLYLGNAPDTFLGAGIQTSKELIQKNLIGNIELGSAFFAFPGVQSYHPNPESWFDKKAGGPVIDMGPYYLTALVNLLGPIKKVLATTKKVFDQRMIGIGPRKGKKFKVNCSTSYYAHLFFKNGCIINLTLSFDVTNHKKNHIELYGTKGSMIVPDPNMFGGSVYISREFGGKWKEYQTHKKLLGKINIRNKSGRLNESPTNANYRGAGLSEMLYAIENKTKHRCNSELSLHVLETIEAIMNSAKSKKEKLIKTQFILPKNFKEKEIRNIKKL